MNVTMNSVMNQVVFTLTSPNRPVNTTTSSTEGTMPPMNCQTRKRPHLVRVLSTILPKIGSRKISAMRMATTSPVIRAIMRAATALSVRANNAVVT